ncbi:hypothetical protein SSX86_004915 [Deinandra increscens subsp. villosa]|uniref:C2H2-type domain-containing protein n=1 Tax=Deinandra increscens subsp. villosa TaxID=3103831 RepID=A0AAP0DKY8_9ASTR
MCGHLVPTLAHFAGREFRSAQALGGHMNVHRRDRARLHHQAQNFKNPNLSSSTNGGLCYLFSLPNPNAVFKPHPSNLMNFPAAVAPLSSYSSNNEASKSIDYKRGNQKDKKIDLTVEGIDLELRLGCSSSSGS